MQEAGHSQLHKHLSLVIAGSLGSVTSMFQGLLRDDVVLAAISSVIRASSIVLMVICITTMLYRTVFSATRDNQNQPCSANCTFTDMLRIPIPAQGQQERTVLADILQFQTTP